MDALDAVAPFVALAAPTAAVLLDVLAYDRRAAGEGAPVAGGGVPQAVPDGAGAGPEGGPAGDGDGGAGQEAGPDGDGAGQEAGPDGDGAGPEAGPDGDGAGLDAPGAVADTTAVAPVSLAVDAPRPPAGGGATPGYEVVGSEAAHAGAGTYGTDDAATDGPENGAAGPAADGAGDGDTDGAGDGVVPHDGPVSMLSGLKTVEGDEPSALRRVLAFVALLAITLVTAGVVAAFIYRGVAAVGG